MADIIKLRLLASRLNPKPKREYDEKIREGVFSRFNPYGVIEPGKDYTERIWDSATFTLAQYAKYYNALYT